MNFVFRLGRSEVSPEHVRGHAWLMQLQKAVEVADCFRPSTLLNSRADALLNAENRVIAAKAWTIDADVIALKSVLENLGKTAEQARDMVDGWQSKRQAVYALKRGSAESGLLLH